MPTTKALLKLEAADEIYDNIKRKRQQAKEVYDKHAKPFPGLEVGEPVRLQPVNPKAPWEKGSCVAKVGPCSFLIETGRGFIDGMVCSFIKILVKYQSYLRSSIAVQ